MMREPPPKSPDRSLFAVVIIILVYMPILTLKASAARCSVPMA